MLTVQNGELIELPAEPPVGSIALDDAARRLGIEYHQAVGWKSILRGVPVVWRDPASGVPWIPASSLRTIRDALDAADTGRLMNAAGINPFGIDVMIFRPGDY